MATGGGINFNQKLQYLDYKMSAISSVMSDKIDDESFVFVFPFDVKSDTGMGMVGTNGIQPARANVENYPDVREVFTGRAQVVAYGTNSMVINKDPNKNPWLVEQEQIGDYGTGKFVSSSTGAVFSSFPSDNQITGNMVQMDTVRTITIHTTFEPSRADILGKFYGIPQHFKADPSTLGDEVQGMYIVPSSVVKNNVGDTVYGEVTFASVNDQIVQTGQSINSYIQYTLAVGKGAVLPQLNYTPQGDVDLDDPVGINQIMLQDLGVTTIQFEFMGNAGFCFPIVIGRPMTQKGHGQRERNIYAPRDLLAVNLRYPVPDPLNRQSNPESVFYGASGTMDTVTQYANGKEATQATYNYALQKSYDGCVVTNDKEVENSNNYPNGAKMLQDVGWQINTKSTVFQVSYDSRPAYGFNYGLSDGTNVGLQSINPYNDMQAVNSTPVNLFNLFRYMFAHIPVLPQESLQKIPWSLNQLPIIGNFLNKTPFGTIGGNQIFKDTDINYPNFTGYPFMVSASMYKWYNEAFWQDAKMYIEKTTQTGYLPFDMFRADASTKIAGILGSQAISTVININITDKVLLQPWSISKKAKDGDMVWCSTLMIGQKDQNNDDIVYLYDPNSITAYTNALTTNPVTDVNGTNSYIIDAVGWSGIFDGDVRITMFRADPSKNDPFASVIYQTTIRSRASWNFNNIHEVQTVYPVSYLNGFVQDQTPFNFPQPIQFPNQPDVHQITVDMTGFMSIYEQIQTSDNEPTYLYSDLTEQNVEDNEPGTSILLHDFSGEFTTGEEVLKNYENLSFVFGGETSFTTYDPSYDDNHTFDIHINGFQYNIDLKNVSELNDSSETGYINGVGPFPERAGALGLLLHNTFGIYQPAGLSRSTVFVASSDPNFTVDGQPLLSELGFAVFRIDRKLYIAKGMRINTLSYVPSASSATFFGYLNFSAGTKMVINIG